MITINLNNIMGSRAQPWCEPTSKTFEVWDI
jgi:hypothetical protein